MILISCVDNALGMRFHGRRQSRDRELCRRILERCGGKLWLGEKSAMLFEAFPQAALFAGCGSGAKHNIAPPGI